MQVQIQLIVALLAVATAIQEQHDIVMYITPTDQDKEFGMCKTTPNRCFTLQELYEGQLQHLEAGFNIGFNWTTLSFMEGTHIVETATPGHFVIKNAVNVTLIGISGVTVVCKQPHAFGIALINISYLTIQNLEMVGCGVEISSEIAQNVYSFDIEGIKSALFLQSIYCLKMLEFTIRNSSGYGIMGVNIFGDSSLLSSRLEFNNIIDSNTQVCRTNSLNSRKKCQGGNAILYYEEPLGCMRTSDVFTLTIKKSYFNHSFNLVHWLYNTGSGFTVIMKQITYSVELNLLESSFNGNSAITGGANLYLAIAATVQSSPVLIKECQITQGNAFSRPPDPGSIDINLYPSFYFIHGSPQIMYKDKSEIIKKCKALKSNETVETDTILHIKSSVISKNIGGGIRLLFADRYQAHQSQTIRIVRIEHTNFTNNVAGVPSSSWLQVQDYSPPQTSRPVHLIIETSHISYNKYPDDFSDIYIPYSVDSKAFQLLGSGIFYSMKNVTIKNCTFIENNFSPVHATRSNIYFIGENLFVNNTSFYGGALYVAKDAAVFVTPNTMMLFDSNHASERGGAIYFQEDYPRVSCPIQVFDPTLRSPSAINIEVIFINNTAVESGDTVYGGSIDSCLPNAPSYFTYVLLANSNEDFSVGSNEPGTYMFDYITNFTGQSISNSMISSTATKICLCLDGKYNCSTGEQILYKYPGEEFHVSLIALGQRGGAVPSVINTVQIVSKTNVKTLQKTERECVKVPYRVSAPLPPYENFEILYMFPDNFLLAKTPPHTTVILLQCPTGFEMDNKRVCNCANSLKERNMTNCDIDTRTITRLPPYWLGNYSDHLLIHDHCPYDYCISTPVQITMKEPNISKQCAFNRTGVLCGQCKEGLSSVLGTSRCLPCPNRYLALIIAFAVAGIALVVFLFLLNLTAAIGTINGLIFYANIVKINEAIFFPPGDNSPLKVFISWVNLDLGIETCFYNGMDSYAKTWLQVVFPLYMWLIMIVIIIGARRSMTLARLFGKQPVPVLATIFLLSFTKLLRVITTSLSLTTLTYPDGIRALWLYDGNVQFGKQKHIALLFLAILFLGGLIPYAVLLTIVQLLRRCSHKIFFLKWIEMYLPIFEAYLRPYKHKYGYWTGLLLIVRAFLVLVFVFNIFGGPGVNLLAITLVVLALIMLNLSQGGVYSSKYCTVLEISFMVNLIILTAVTGYNRQEGGNQQAAIYTSTSIAMGTFAVILTYHAYTAVPARFRNRVQRGIYHSMWKLLRICKFKSEHEERVEILTERDVEMTDKDQQHKPTETIVEIRPEDSVDSDPEDDEEENENESESDSTH